jgi:hypothetical protein
MDYRIIRKLIDQAEKIGFYEVRSLQMIPNKPFIVEVYDKNGDSIIFNKYVKSKFIDFQFMDKNNNKTYCSIIACGELTDYVEFEKLYKRHLILKNEVETT